MLMECKVKANCSHMVTPLSPPLQSEDTKTRWGLSLNEVIVVN